MRRNVTSVGPGITVEKISAQPIPPPVTPVVGKPVTGKEVRLVNNLIIPTEDGKSRFIPRGEIIDINLVPEHLRTDQLIEAPDAFREGKIMMLHDFSCAVPNFDGDRVVYREKLFSAFSLVDPASIPNRVMEGLTEGEDFLSQWHEADRKQKEIERQKAVEEYSMEGPEIPEDVSAARDPHNRYGDSL